MNKRNYSLNCSNHIVSTLGNSLMYVEFIQRVWNCDTVQCFLSKSFHPSIFNMVSFFRPLQPVSVPFNCIFSCTLCDWCDESIVDFIMPFVWDEFAMNTHARAHVCVRIFVGGLFHEIWCLKKHCHFECDWRNFDVFMCCINWNHSSFAILFFHSVPLRLCCDGT